MKTDIHINEAKEAAAKAGKTVFNAVTSVFNVGEVKRQAKEIETLKKENYNLSFKNQNLEGQLRTNNIEMRRVQETTHNQPFSGNGKCTGKYRGTPNYGNTK